MAFVRAKVIDPTHLELSRPLSAPEGNTVLVYVAESGDEDEERLSWLRASSESLALAHGESEPDYTPAMIQESNPEYDP